MEKLEALTYIYEQVRSAGLARSQKEFSTLIDVNKNCLSSAMNGDPRYLTDSLVAKATKFYNENVRKEDNGEIRPKATLPVIPTEAMAGTLGEFADSIQGYECERMVSPIKGADYAIKVCGDSMSPEIPNGSHILIKKICEDQFVEWGKIYCLDTRNGAVIKRIYPTDDPQVVECRSVNSEYPPFQVNVMHINGWYRVLMVLALK